MTVDYFYDEANVNISLIIPSEWSETDFNNCVEFDYDDVNETVHITATDLDDTTPYFDKWISVEELKEEFVDIRF